MTAIRHRWLGLPIQRLAYAIETEGVNGHRSNPPGEPARIEATYSGRGQYTGFILDGQGRELTRIQAHSLKELLALLAQRYRDVPVRVMPLRNPGAAAWCKETAVSDRAHRYRAASHPPPGPRICAWCGATRTIEIAHVDGHEEHGGQDNLAWICRSCNVIVANVLRRAGLGRATVQFNPASQGAESLSQWVTAVMSMKGESGAMSVEAAVEMVHATDPERRSQFAHEIWRMRRQRYGPSGRSDSVPF
jgi:hypothetical protein